MDSCTKSAVIIDDSHATLDALLDVSVKGRAVALSDDQDWTGRVHASRERLEEAVRAGVPVYGVNTGVGFSSGRKIDAEAQANFADIIVRQHGCGVGVPLAREEGRAVVFARLVSLSKACSSVRLELLEAMTALLERDVIPVIPRFGSVGASGDLTPLSYLVAVIQGEREAYFEGRILPAAAALEKAGLQPLQMIPKEQLAIMNGTSVMTAVGAITVARLERTLALCDRLSAVAAEVVFGRTAAFDEAAHLLKPHPGQLASAKAIREALAGSRMMDVGDEQGRMVQDPYSIRCAPQAIGAARDAASWARENLERELNSVNDNPIVIPDTGEILFAGNFYGGHVALGMDLVKIAAASVADLLDRQFALLLDSRLNLGLPETLVAYGGNGTKGLQITCSALTSLAVQRSASDTVLSRPTEVQNQDKVSMGMNAAVHASEVVTILQQVLATELIAVSNAAALRDEALFSPAGRELLAEIRERSPVLTEDRRFDIDIEALEAFIDQV